MEFSTEHNGKGGVRFDIKNPPPAGTKLKTTFGEDVIFDEVGIAGMLVCTRVHDNFQQLYFPNQLVV